MGVTVWNNCSWTYLTYLHPDFDCIKWMANISGCYTTEKTTKEINNLTFFFCLTHRFVLAWVDSYFLSLLCAQFLSVWPHTCYVTSLFTVNTKSRTLKKNVKTKVKSVYCETRFDPGENYPWNRWPGHFSLRNKFILDLFSLDFINWSQLVLHKTI